MRLVAAASVLCGLVASIFLAVHPPAGLGQAGSIALIGAAWLLFALGIWLIKGVSARAAAVLVLLGGIALPLVAGFAPPRSSDDLYRYEWDGRVQAAGIDPYRYAPVAPELVRFRDPELWPEHSAWCVDTGCTLINRPTVHTIYPPVAEAYFVVVHYAPGEGYRPYQLAAAVIAIAATLLLLRVVGRQAVLWAWCPTVALEAGNNAHVDVLAALLTAIALLVLARRRSIVGGAMLGLAVGAKLTPALVVPAVLKRRPVAVLSAIAGALVLVYLPHVLAVGTGVLGYLPGYLGEEGYANGSRFALLSLVLPDFLAMPVAAIILAVAAVLVAQRSDPDRPWHGATVLVAVSLLVAAPGYPWYALLLVILVALDGRARWLAVAFAGHVALYGPDLHLAAGTAQRLGYGMAILMIMLSGARSRRPAEPAGEPLPRLDSVTPPVR